MTKAYLCVGGPKDGELIATDRENFTAVADTGSDSSVSYVAYKLVKLVGERQVFDVYVMAGTTGDDLLRQLIANYRPKVDEELAAR